MADDGELYKGFDIQFVEKIKTIAFNSDIIIPNITEACLLTNTKYLTNYDEKYIYNIIDRLHRNGAKTIILTGVSYDEKNYTGVFISSNSENL